MRRGPSPAKARAPGERRCSGAGTFPATDRDHLGDQQRKRHGIAGGDRERYPEDAFGEDEGERAQDQPDDRRGSAAEWGPGVALEPEQDPGGIRAQREEKSDRSEGEPRRQVVAPGRLGHRDNDRGNDEIGSCDEEEHDCRCPKTCRGEVGHLLPLAMARQGRQDGDVERLAEKAPDHERHDRGDEIEIGLRTRPQERRHEHDLREHGQPLDAAARQCHRADEGRRALGQAAGAARRGHAAEL